MLLGTMLDICYLRLWFHFSDLRYGTSVAQAVLGRLGEHWPFRRFEVSTTGLPTSKCQAQ